MAAYISSQNWLMIGYNWSMKKTEKKAEEKASDVQKYTDDFPKVKNDGIKGQKAWVFFKKLLHLTGFIVLFGLNGFENKRD
jgi:hypothetical protein